MPAPVLRHVRPRVLLAWSALVVAGGIAAVAVEPEPEHAEVATAASDDTPTTPLAPRRSASTTSTTATTAAVDPATTAAPTTAAPTPETTEPTAVAEDTTPAPAVTEPPAVQLLAPAAGSYPVTMSGTSSGSGQLVIEQLSATDQRLTVPGGLGQLVLVVRYTEVGAELVSLDLAAGPVIKSFHPGSGALLFSFDAPVGTNWSWSTTSADGSTHVDQAASVIDSGTANVGGASVPVNVIRTTLTVSGDVNGTVVLTSTVAPAQRLLVGQRQVADVTAFGFPVTADTTMLLQSLVPS